MRERTTKRALALCLSLALLLGLLPTAAFAAEAEKEQFSLTPGQTYWFDLSGAAIPGTANTGNDRGAATIPDTTLHWAPFTYAGTVNAYVLKSRSGDGETAKADSQNAANSTEASNLIGHTYDHSLFIADYVVTNTVSWDDLDAQNKQMIFGSPYASGGVDYTLRAPSAGSAYTGKSESERGTPDGNEWDAILNKAKQGWKDNDAGYIKNWNKIASWGQDTYALDASSRAIRGITSARIYGYTSSGTRDPLLGFRPVLEILNPDTLTSDGLKAVSLDLNGGNAGTTATKQDGPVNIVVKSGEGFTAPSGEGLTRPDGYTHDYFKWLDSDGNRYDPGDTVPASVTALTAEWAAPANLTGITAPAAVTEVANGTPLADIGLPDKVAITTTGGEMQAGVTWDRDAASSSYDPAVKTEQTFTIGGTVTLPGDVTNTDSVSLAVTVSVTVAAEGADAITGIRIAATPAKTAYTEGDALDLSGLSVGLIIRHSHQKTVALADFADNGVTTTPANGAALSVSDTAVTVSAGGKSASFDITVQAAQSHTHDYSGPWQSDAAEHWKLCTAGDGGIGNRAAHTSSGWITDQPATTTTAGKRHRECTVCAYVLERGTIPATGSGGGGGSDHDTPSPMEQAVAKVEKAKAGDTVKVDLPSSGKLSNEILEEAAGKDITLEIEAGKGVTWIVNGKDIPSGKLSDLNLKVNTKANTIPVTVINTVTGEEKVMQLTLSHNGEFPFPLTLRLDAGKENAGLFANLYYYNETAKELEYQSTAEIDADGNAHIPFAHASSYAVVIDATSHGKYNPNTGGDNPFTDVKEKDWFFSAVMYVYHGGIMQGTSATTFSPKVGTTRAQLATILWRMEGSPAPTGGNPFSDVPEGTWYTDAVAWCAGAELVGGYGGGLFGPNDPITREQLAALLYRYAVYKGWDVSVGEDTNILSYADAFAVSEWAIPAVQWAVGAGIMSGADNRLAPQEGATRAQIAAMLMRLLEQYAPGSTLPATGGTVTPNPSTGVLNVPQTGDGTGAGWLMLALPLSAAGAAVLSHKLRRKRREGGADELPDPTHA